MTEHSKLIAYIEKQVRQAEQLDLFRSWLNMTRQEILDLAMTDAFVAVGLMKRKDP